MGNFGQYFVLDDPTTRKSLSICQKQSSTTRLKRLENGASKNMYSPDKTQMVPRHVRPVSRSCVGGIIHKCITRATMRQEREVILSSVPIFTTTMKRDPYCLSPFSNSYHIRVVGYNDTHRHMVEKL